MKITDLLKLEVQTLLGGNCIICKRFNHHKVGILTKLKLPEQNKVEKTTFHLCRECETNIKLKRLDYPLYYNTDLVPMVFMHG